MATAVEYLMKLLDKFEAIQNLKTAEESYGIKPSKQAERSISDITADIGENKDKIESLEKRRRGCAGKMKRPTCALWVLIRSKRSGLLKLRVSWVN